MNDKVNKIQIPDGWEEVELGNDNYFKILGSGIKLFNGTKDYLSTSSIEIDKVVNVEQEITYKTRPSRANMQPILNSVWFAKMKNTLKIFNPTNTQIKNTILSTGFCGILSNNVESDYLFQIFLSNEFNNQKDLLAIGSTQEAINNTKAKQVHFLLPKSTTEQKKIAEILSKVDTAIEQTQSLIAKYQRIKTGLMQDLLTKGIDENGNIRSEETHEFKDSELGMIPKDWEVDKLETICITDITYGIVQAGPNIENGIPYIRTGDMSGDALKLSGLMRTTPEIASKFKRSTVREGEIVFALRATIGKVLLVPSELDGANLTQGTARISSDEDVVKNNFLIWCLRMDYFKNQILQNQKGTTFSEISLGQLRKMKVSFPKDTIEQDKIINILEEQVCLIYDEQQKLQKLQSIKTGLMQDLLSGKKRVTNLIKEKAL